MLLLSVDIAARKGGSNCGVVLIDPLKIVALGEPSDDLIWVRGIDGTDLAAIASVIGEAKAYGGALVRESEHGEPKPAGCMMVLERQFTARMSPDPSAVEKLISARVRFETVATIRGMPWLSCYPSEWQAVLLELLGADYPMKVLKPRKPKVPKTKRGQAPTPAPAQQTLVAAPKMIRDTKAAARLLCSRLYPNVELTGDQCDALMMARHAWRTLR